VVNLKKGQFPAPRDVRHAVQKVRDSGNDRVFVTERGFSFGYNTSSSTRIPDDAELVSRRLDVMHSLHRRVAAMAPLRLEHIDPLVCAGVGAGVDGVFLEVHEEPAKAKSDAQNVGADKLPAARKLVRIAIKQRSSAHRRFDRSGPSVPRWRPKDLTDSRLGPDVRAPDLLQQHGQGRVIVTGMVSPDHSESRRRRSRARAPRRRSSAEAPGGTSAQQAGTSVIARAARRKNWSAARSDPHRRD
jgi:hypothetical protein